jgi:hypothetical protein
VFKEAKWFMLISNVSAAKNGKTENNVNYYLR